MSETDSDAGEDATPTRQSIYPSRGLWRWLRQLSVQHETTASALIIAAAEWFRHDASERARRAWIDRAKSITAERRSR